MTSTYLLTTIAAMAMAIASTAAVAQPDQARLGPTAVHIAKHTRANPVLRKVPNRSLPRRRDMAGSTFPIRVRRMRW